MTEIIISLNTKKKEKNLGFYVSNQLILISKKVSNYVTFQSCPLEHKVKTTDKHELCTLKKMQMFTM